MRDHILPSPGLWMCGSTGRRKVLRHTHSMVAVAFMHLYKVKQDARIPRNRGGEGYDEQHASIETMTTLPRKIDLQIVRIHASAGTLSIQRRSLYVTMRRVKAEWTGWFVYSDVAAKESTCSRRGSTYMYVRCHRYT